MASEGLRITYRRSGGFAGIDMVAECLAADLPDDQARVASELLGESGQGEKPRSSPGPSPGPSAGAGADQFSYTLRITGGGGDTTYNWSEGAVPERARPLLAALGGMSKPSRGR